MLNENFATTNEGFRCPIYFEDHSYGGIVSQIENLVDYDFGFTVRSTFINGVPYFAAVDICKGLALSTDHTTHHVMQAVNDVLESGYGINQMVDNYESDPSHPMAGDKNPVNSTFFENESAPLHGMRGQNPAKSRNSAPLWYRGGKNLVKLRVYK